MHLLLSLMQIFKNDIAKVNTGKTKKDKKDISKETLVINKNIIFEIISDSEKI